MLGKDFVEVQVCVGGMRNLALFQRTGDRIAIEEQLDHERVFHQNLREKHPTEMGGVASYIRGLLTLTPQVS